MSTSRQSLTLDALCSVAAAYPGIVGVKQGYSSEQDGDSVYQKVRALTPYTQGYFYAWLKHSSFTKERQRGFTILGEMLTYTPKETNSTLDATHDFLNGFIATAGDWVNYPANVLYPEDIAYELHKIDTTRTGVTTWCFGAHGKGHIHVLGGQ